MSTKRMLTITAFGVLLIVTVIAVMFISSYLGRSDDVVPLPEPSVPPSEPIGGEIDSINRVEVTPETVQSVIPTLERPEEYSRNVQIRSFWDGGEISYSINTAVADRVTSLRSQSSVGDEKRIILTHDTIYIWYIGDPAVFTGNINSPDDWYRIADEWLMLVTFEDVLRLDSGDIIETGYIDYNDEDCIFVVYLSPLLGYRRSYYVSIELGLVVGAEEHDSSGQLVYHMTAGPTTIGEVDLAMFTLPDGTEILK